MLLSIFFEMQMTYCRISIQALTFETFIRKYKIDIKFKALSISRFSVHPKQDR